MSNKKHAVCDCMFFIEPDSFEDISITLIFSFLKTGIRYTLSVGWTCLFYWDRILLLNPKLRYIHSNRIPMYRVPFRRTSYSQFLYKALHLICFGHHFLR